MTRLLHLPGEIRNRIYTFLYPDSHARILSERHPGEHTSFPGLTPDQNPESGQCRRRRRHRHRRRLGCLERSLFPTRPTALLTTCRQLSAEAVPFLYASTTFRFDSMHVIHRFLSQASPGGIKHISRLVLRHAAYGEPAKQENCRWKVKYDQRWAETCKRIATEAVALEHLQLSLEISDWPTQLNLAAKWAKPLLVLKGEGLDRVDVILNHSRFHPQRLFAAARMIEKGMMKEEGVQQKQREADLAATKKRSGPDDRGGRKTPKAIKVLFITSTEPAPAPA